MKILIYLITLLGLSSFSFAEAPKNLMSWTWGSKTFHKVEFNEGESQIDFQKEGFEWNCTLSGGVTAARLICIYPNTEAKVKISTCCNCGERSHNSSIAIWSPKLKRNVHVALRCTFGKEEKNMFGYFTKKTFGLVTSQEKFVKGLKENGCETSESDYKNEDYFENPAYDFKSDVTSFYCKKSGKYQIILGGKKESLKSFKKGCSKVIDTSHTISRSLKFKNGVIQEGFHLTKGCNLKCVKNKWVCSKRKLE